jgi:hypothetical protein
MRHVRRLPGIARPTLTPVEGSEVANLVRSRDGQWFVRPPERCGNGHPITPGRVLVGTAVCACQDRHLTWSCECGSTVYGPELGPGCAVLDGPARVR